jgi:PIN domain nuclease of toxin-antitoxin system
MNLLLDTYTFLWFCQGDPSNKSSAATLSSTSSPCIHQAIR